MKTIRFRRYFAVILLAVMTVLVMLAGCGSRNREAEYYVQETTAAAAAGDYAAEDYAVSDYGIPSHAMAMAPAEKADVSYEYEADNGFPENPPSYDSTSVPSDRKLVRTVNISYESDRFDEFTALLKEQTAAFGGYIESSGLSRRNGRKDAPRNADFTIRIPADKLDAFLKATEEQASVLSRNEYTEDITLNYHDTESRKKALEVEQERLMELLEKADTMEAIIALEERLSEIRYELDNYNSTLRRYDNRVDYATVNISVSETAILTPTKEATFLEKIQSGFLRNLEDVGEALTDLIIWFITSIPTFICLAAFGFIAVFATRPLRRKLKAKREERAAKKELNKTEGKNHHADH